MKPQGFTLAKYMASRARVSFIIGPLGSGKTFQSCQKILKLMTEQKVATGTKVRKSRWFAVRNTYPDLLSTTVKDWLDLFGELGHYKGAGQEPPVHKLKFKLEDGTRVESELIFFAMDLPKHVKKLRGVQATGFWLNETKELEKSVVDMCDLRHGRYPSKMEGGCTWHGMIGDSNAPDDDHWLYELAEDIKPINWEFFIQPGGVVRAGMVENRVIWRINPDAENMNNLPDGYYQQGMEGKRDDWIGVNLANEYGVVMEGRAVYPEYTDAIHLATEPLEPIRGLPLILGWDFGGTPACIIAQYTRQGQLRILDELVSDGIRLRGFIAEAVKPTLQAKYAGMEIQSVGDPAGIGGNDNDAGHCFLELSQAGIPTEQARTNIISPRIEAVAGFLRKLVVGKAGLLLSPTCKILRKGFAGGYQYRRMQIPGKEQYTDKPDKNDYSHPHDALQYIALHCEVPPMHKKRKTVRRRETRPNYNV